MSHFDVRKATLRDEASVSDVLEASYSMLLASSYSRAVLDDALPKMAKANRLLLSSGKYYVAECDEGSMVGCGGWSLERPGTGEVAPLLGHVRHFGVSPTWIGRGVGRSIYSMCEEQARAAGVRRLECDASLNAEGFYAALGFRPVRSINVTLGPDVSLPGILMERSI